MHTIELTYANDIPYHPGRRPADAPDSLTRTARSLSPRMTRLLEWMAMGGVLSPGQLGIALRNLQYYAKAGLISRIPRMDLEPVFDADYQAFYCLGDVGEKIIQSRWPVAPLSGYLNYSPSRIAHDIYTNEVVLRLAKLFIQNSWSVFWAGTNAAEIRAGSEQWVEPDALLIVKKDSVVKSFAVEYHNEQGKTQRANEKVRRYSRVFSAANLWMPFWEVESFPVVLAVFRDDAVGRGYQSAAREMSSNNVTFLCKSIRAFDAGANGNIESWINAASGQRESIL